MKRTLYLILCLACLCWQCKEAEKPVPKAPDIKKINVLDFTIPGVDPKNISIGKDLIVINLPENYAAGDYIKPEVVLEAGYNSTSPALDGFKYENQEVGISLHSNNESRNFNIIVVPFKAIQLAELPKNLQLTLEPDTQIKTAFKLKGTVATVFEGETLIYAPKIRFTSKATGEIAYELYDPGYSRFQDSMSVTLPATMVPGEYKAEVVWGPKAELLSSQIIVKPGAVSFRRGSWHMLEPDRYFEVNGFNFSSAGKYEAIIENDFTAPERIALKYEKPGSLSGNLPKSIGLGNYKITYLENEKEKKPYSEKQWLLQYSGEDHFFITRTRTQPIARIVTQPSRRSSFKTYLNSSLHYFPSVTEISRKEPILVYSETWGPTPDKIELVLVDHQSKKEFVLPFSGSVYGIFDGFLTFPAFPVTDDIPDGAYEIYMVRGMEKTERYSRIITLR
ncbi:hypothetical protein [Dyadobacter sediminis]|uniref:Uncharacterized protein n=1 Tax=Dyadobacter sediminis TaxID=1493691 RepID=A0A5R9KBL9_9BACT|nr:hypothetical protein [Dyadobacter sediminis]TLU92206.1 hypothetical protein FEM55_15810 [Dyadobacter sediminis]GGB96545.1 hypothetical protein GCM10011325_24840 [Dyadobacter sediminis]